MWHLTRMTQKIQFYITKSSIQYKRMRRTKYEVSIFSFQFLRKFLVSGHKYSNNCIKKIKCMFNGPLRRRIEETNFFPFLFVQISKYLRPTHEYTYQNRKLGCSPWTKLQMPDILSKYQRIKRKLSFTFYQFWYTKYFFWNCKPPGTSWKCCRLEKHNFNIVGGNGDMRKTERLQGSLARKSLEKTFRRSSYLKLTETIIRQP